MHVHHTYQESGNYYPHVYVRAIAQSYDKWIYGGGVYITIEELPRPVTPYCYTADYTVKEVYETGYWRYYTTYPTIDPLVYSTVVFDVYVSWGDSYINTYTFLEGDFSIAHRYRSTGIYTIKVKIRLANGASVYSYYEETPVKVTSNPDPVDPIGPKPGPILIA